MKIYRYICDDLVTIKNITLEDTDNLRLFDILKFFKNSS